MAYLLLCVLRPAVLNAVLPTLQLICSCRIGGVWLALTRTPVCLSRFGVTLLIYRRARANQVAREAGSAVEAKLLTAPASRSRSLRQLPPQSPSFEHQFLESTFHLPPSHPVALKPDDQFRLRWLSITSG